MESGGTGLRLADSPGDEFIERGLLHLLARTIEGNQDAAERRVISGRDLREVRGSQPAGQRLLGCAHGNNPVSPGNRASPTA